MGKRSRPFTWEGVTYPSKVAAAKALGVHPNTIAYWEKNGYTCAADMEQNKVNRVEYKGVWYDSIKKAAQAFGVSYIAMYHRIQRYRAGSEEHQEVEVDGKIYKTLSFAAKRLGTTPYKLRRYLDEGIPYDKDLRETNGRGPKPVVLDGVRYPSFKAACEASGYTLGGLQYLINVGARAYVPDD